MQEYPSFRDMLQRLPIAQVGPLPQNIHVTPPGAAGHRHSGRRRGNLLPVHTLPRTRVANRGSFYTTEEQRQFSVLAIGIEIADDNRAHPAAPLVFMAAQSNPRRTAPVTCLSGPLPRPSRG